MRYGSVCSGIEAASVAWENLGWEPAWFSEIEKFPSAVLAHHWPEVENLGDMLELVGKTEDGEIEAPDVLVGGTPCQAFSVAGRRGSLEDERGALTLAYIELLNRIDERRKEHGKEPCICVWENVPGVLNTKDNAFGCFLAGLTGESEPLHPSGKRWTNAGCVYGPERTVAWRVLDAQYFGVAQRRRRVFVVASAGAGFDPAAVLFESKGVRRDTAPSRETREETTGDVGRRFTPSSFGGYREGLGTLRAQGGDYGGGTEMLIPTEGCFWNGEQVTQTLDAVLHKGQTMPEKNRFPAVLQPACQVVHGTQDPCVGELAFALGRNSGQENVLALNVHENQGRHEGVMQPDITVRRLTPVECERLQGFLDGHTNIRWRERRKEPAGSGPCAKQQVRATVVTPDGKHYVGTNFCVTPQKTCPREQAGISTGEGYELCREVCGQEHHAEVNALKTAGKHAVGATIYLEGHTYACDACVAAAEKAGIVEIKIAEPPGNAPDGPRYKAIGNSMAVPVMHWIGARIASVVFRKQKDCDESVAKR